MKTCLDKDEKKLVGGWVEINGQLETDMVTDRINFLTDKVLIKLSTSEDGWDVLFQDRSDGRLWELTFPQSAIHGGGPPTLTCIGMEIAMSKYKME